MIFGSVCSGIEAASCAWHPLGWQTAFVSEIEPFPCAVLSHHYPTVPNLGDMTKFKEWPDATIDLLVGGTPCQSFSVAGLRKGLADPRGNLMLTYLAIAERYAPRWLVWENVPGVLSSNGGRDFGTLLGGLAELGYGFSYRVLDAQYVRVESHSRAVPQRRRRVFVVGHLGDWRRAAAVLFERESMLGHPAPRREAGKGIAPTLSARTKGGGGLGTDFDCDGGLVAHSLRGEGFDASEDGTGRGTPLIPIAFDCKASGQNGFGVGDIASTMRSMGHSNSHQNGGGHLAVAFDMRGREGGAQFEGPHETANIRAASGGSSKSYVATEWAVRRLTPMECERLQGFPEITKSLKITVWRSLDHQKNFALAAIQSRRSPLSVSNADASALRLNANAAGLNSHIAQQSQSEHVAAHVLIDLERQVLRLHSHGRLLWSASTAESQSSYLLRMPSDAFARLVAHTITTAERGIQAGRVASQPNTRHFLHQENGSVSAHLYGREIDALANDAERFTQSLSRCMKSTTSEVGQDSLNSEPILETLCCCVAAAISSSIPDSIRTASSFDVVVETVTGYTNIPYRGKPAADGPRYKALGNSMAVPVMSWIGRRIQLVEETMQEIEREPK